MKIVVLSDDNDLKIKKFAQEEWKKWNLEHYGREDAFMDEKIYFIRASQKEDIVGFIRLGIEGGVAFIYSILVKEKYQRKGVGKKLFSEAEKLAKKQGCHKIQLYTGKNWRQRGFYDALGFKKTNDLPDQYLRQDFVEYTKYLK